MCTLTSGRLGTWVRNGCWWHNFNSLCSMCTSTYWSTHFIHIASPLKLSFIKPHWFLNCWASRFFPSSSHLCSLHCLMPHIFTLCWLFFHTSPLLFCFCFSGCFCPQLLLLLLLLFPWELSKSGTTVEELVSYLVSETSECDNIFKVILPLS